MSFFFALHFETINKRNKSIIQHNYLLQCFFPYNSSTEFYAFISLPTFNQLYSLNLILQNINFHSLGESYEINEHEVYFNLNF